MITNLMTGLTTILFIWCVLQLYFFISVGVAEMFLLATMAFDRYQAICSPLHYMNVMNTTLCNWLQLICWISGFIVNLPLSFTLLRLDFSGNNIINHFLCDGPGLMKLSCSDTKLNDLISFILSLTIMLSCFFFTLMSYMWIIKTIMNLPSSTGKIKTFSTCSSHLTAATMYYGALIFMYVRPRSINMYDMNKIVSLFYTVIVPVLNPLIYSLRNKEVKYAVRKMLM
ncbi:olfactory receptor 11L1-like [Spea bombifrons]|uniref:olfactory receptor 11L1-like n=1 Tax=Spea bombifrons TaxID=233779 RepID=UPI00234B371B|nr:olfactory receptor 11L1-like [Spea bombifrons]